MNELHSLLKRQLRRFTNNSAETLGEGQTDFLQAINDAYWQFDADRRMLEHSLELTSQELLERNAELSRINAELEIRVAARTTELSGSEARFRGLFEYAPISIWEEDFSAVRQYINELRGAGVIDFSAYFDMHPEVVAESAARVKIVDVNRTTLEMYQAASKEQLLTDLTKILGAESLIPFKEELLALIRGDKIFETELVNYTLRGERRVVFIHMTVAPGYTETWSKVFVGISDITERRQAEEALHQSEEKYRSLVERLPAITYISAFDEAKTRLYVSPQNEKYLGFSPTEWLTDPDLWRNQLHPDDRERVLAEAARFYETEEPFISEYRTLSRDGKSVWFHDEAVIVRDAKGQPQYIQGVKVNITERKQAEEALRQSEERFKLMAWATKDAVWDWNFLTNQIEWGIGLQKIFHYSSETTQTDSEWRLEHIHTEDREKVSRSMNQALEGGLEFWSKEYRFQRVDQTYANIMDRGYILRDHTGKPYRIIGAMMDITAQKQAENELLEANEKMARSLSELELRNQEIILLNEMSDLLQASLSEKEAHAIIANAARNLFPGTAGALYLFNNERTLVTAAASWGDPPPAARLFAPNECWALRRGQTHRLYSDEAKPPCGHISEPMPAITYCLPMVAQGEILGILHLQSPSKENMNEPKHQLAYTVVEQAAMALSNLKLREALREQSIRDSLTGLYNRRYMEEVLKQHLRRVTRHLHPLGIIMIDIDHFKSFNDAYGHAAGDALLRELGRFLQSHIRAEDVACRYGGEEFILIMPDTSLETAQQRAEYIRDQAQEVHIHDTGLSLPGITLSLGVAIYPQHGRSMETVMRAADAALYRAKQEGRNRVVVATSAN